MPKSLLLPTLLLITACHHDRDAAGPMERAGKGVDSAADKTGTALQGAAEKTGDALTRATRATGRAFERAGSKLQGKGSEPAPASPKPTETTSKPAPVLSPADE